jgi:hypothetical protein
LLIGVRGVAVMALALAMMGCDPNPGGPAVPPRGSAPPAVAPTSEPAAKKPVKLKVKKLAPMQHTATYE